MADPPSPRFVRQFALTGGRARSRGRDLPLDTLVRTTAAGRRLSGLAAEEAAILRRCRDPLSIAEISAHLRVHLGVARVLVGDLAARGAVAVAAGQQSADGPDLATLERLFDDLKAL